MSFTARMNHIVDSESHDFRDMVVMIKKSETTDLMDYTNSGHGGSQWPIELEISN